MDENLTSFTSKSLAVGIKNLIFGKLNLVNSIDLQNFHHLWYHTNIINHFLLIKYIVSEYLQKQITDYQNTV